jgi:hypothetical protein
MEMTMRKLKLDPDAMQVESFSPQALPAERGTAFGYSGVYGPACASAWPNCNDIPDISWWSCNRQQA